MDRRIEIAAKIIKTMKNDRGLILVTRDGESDFDHLQAALHAVGIDPIVLGFVSDQDIAIDVYESIKAFSDRTLMLEVEIGERNDPIINQLLTTMLETGQVRHPIDYRDHFEFTGVLILVVRHRTRIDQAILRRCYIVDLNY